MLRVRSGRGPYGFVPNTTPSCINFPPLPECALWLLYPLADGGRMRAFFRHPSPRTASRRLCSVTSSHYSRAADVYDSAPFYSTAERNHETLVGLVVDRLALRAEHRLVDIGAGNGAFTDSLIQRVGGERATIVEPSLEFMAGVHAYPSVVAVHASLEEWSKGERAGGDQQHATSPPRYDHSSMRSSDAPPPAAYDRMLLKEVVHHLGDSTERHESLRQLRAHRLTPSGRLLIVTRHQEQPQIPLFSEARKVWAEQQPSGDEIRDDLERAGFARVRLTSTTLEYTMPLDEWCALVRRRFWSERADASNPSHNPNPNPNPNPDPDPDSSRLSPTSPMPHSTRALLRFGELTRRAHALRALGRRSLQSAIGWCSSARRLGRRWRLRRQHRRESTRRTTVAPISVSPFPWGR